MFKIFDNLIQGRYIQRNDSFLSRELSINRKTVKRRIDVLIKNGIISEPRCFFSNLFLPPEYNLIVSMIEVKSKKQQLRNFFLYNDNISRGLDASLGRYNFLIFSAFRKIENFFEMGEEMMSKFPNCVGAVSNIILSSKTVHAIKPQKLSLSWIERKLWQISNIE